MKSIGITELKKQAKLLRKNNNNIKNHSESLDLIAAQYDFKKWDDLINQSSLILNNNEDNNHKLNSLNSLFAAFPATVIYGTIISLLPNNENKKDFWYIRSCAFIKMLINLLVILRDDNKTLLDVESIIDFMELEEIYKLSIRSDINSLDLKPLKNYLVNMPGYDNDRINNQQLEHHGYVVMMFSPIFNDIINQWYESPFLVQGSPWIYPWALSE